MSETKCHKQLNPQERVRKAEVSSRTINWELCVFCQGKTNENLQCPANSKREDIGARYKSAEASIREFKRLGISPFKVDFDQLDDGSGIANSLLKHKAVWHKSCRNKINSTELKRAEKRKQKEETPEAASPVKTRRLSSSSTKSNKGKCFFCNEASSGLRSAATDTITHRVRSCATLLQDTELLAKLAAGSDMVAIDGEYHPKCLAALYNRVDSRNVRCIMKTAILKVITCHKG